MIRFDKQRDLDIDKIKYFWDKGKADFMYLEINSILKNSALSEIRTDGYHRARINSLIATTVIFV